MVILSVLHLFGVTFPNGTDATVTEAISTLVGVVMLAWGQFDRTDLKYGLIRK